MDSCAAGFCGHRVSAVSIMVAYFAHFHLFHVNSSFFSLSHFCYTGFFYVVRSFIRSFVLSLAFVVSRLVFMFFFCFTSCLHVLLLQLATTSRGNAADVDDADDADVRCWCWCMPMLSPIRAICTASQLFTIARVSTMPHILFILLITHSQVHRFVCLIRLPFWGRPVISDCRIAAINFLQDSEGIF